MSSRSGSGGEVMRRPSEILRRGYLDEELKNLYALARLWVEGGDTRGAETIFAGIRHVAPHFAPGWLGLAYVRALQGEIERAADYARAALEAEPESIEAMLFLICCSLTLSDYNTAGTLLGEVGDRVEANQVRDAGVLRFYRLQLARFHNR